MRKTLLSAVSLLAIMSAAPAMAEGQSKDRSDASTPQQMQEMEHTQTSPKGDMEQSWDKTKNAVSETADDVSDATKEAYQDIKTTIIGEDPSTDVKLVNVEYRQTAVGMLGEPVFNTNGERVGKIHDIILDSGGDASMVVVSDGNFLGLGKKVAFNYDVVTNRSAEGDLITPLTEETISQAAEFSYDPNDSGSATHVMPSNGYSVRELLDSNVVDPNNNEIADVENIVFRNGEASQVIVGFGKVLGMGGEKASLVYDDAKLVRNGDNKYDFQLSANQAKRFNDFKKSVN